MDKTKIIMEESKMDMSDFTSAENKKMTTENDIPTFQTLL